jgi:hypothetical protein
MFVWILTLCGLILRDQRFGETYCLYLRAEDVVFGGVMVSVLVIGRKVLEFKPSRLRWILRVIKIFSTPSFGGEVKPSAPCRKILWHAKEPFEASTKILRKDKFSISFTSSSCFATSDCW